MFAVAARRARGAVAPSALVRKASGAAARPLSPHLTVYKFGPNMITSVMFRGTGIVMTGGVAVLALSAFSSKSFKEQVYTLQRYPVLNALVKFGVAFPLSYHYLGGLRHLAWDNIIGNTIKSVNQTGYAAVAAAGAISLVAMVYEGERDE